MVHTMNEQKTSGIRVNIFGKEYPIKGDTSHGQIKEVAEYVDLKMKEIAKNAPIHSHERVAILAALNIAADLYRERIEHEKIQMEMESKIEGLTHSVNEELLEE